MDTLGELIFSHPRLFRGKTPRVASWIPHGWATLVSKLCGDIESLLLTDCDRFTVEQIKEKFGSLRFYWTFVDAGDEWHPSQHPINPMRYRSEPAQPNQPYVRLRDLIDAAEAESETVCIRFGARADPAAAHGFYHYCSKHCFAEVVRGWQS